MCEVFIYFFALLLLQGFDLIDKILWLIFLTFVPVFELRWSIPVGIYSGSIVVPFFGLMQGFALDPLLVFFVCVLANAFLALISYFFFDKIIGFFLKIKFIDGWYKKFVVRTQKKVSPLVEKYGLLGLAFFIAIPLPGSGTWTGTLAGYLLGFGWKRIFLANLVGVIISGIIVTLVTIGAFSFI